MPADAKTALRHNAEKGTPTFALTDLRFAQTYPFFDSPTAPDKPIKPPTFRLTARCLSIHMTSAI